MTETPPTDFASLIARAAEGDPAALDELSRQYEPKVRLVARVMLGPGLRPYLESIDLAQSVHHSILVGLRDSKFSVASPEQLVALALTVLRRKAGRHWRHLRRQSRLSGAFRPGTEELPDVLTALCSTEENPADSAERRDQIRQLCDRLDEDERRMLELLVDGHSQNETADLMGVSRVALRVRLTRLRRRLAAAGLDADWF